MREEAWQVLEKTLTALVASLEPELNRVTRDLLNDFVKNREYGVAIEWLKSYLDEHGLKLSDQQDEEIRRIFELLGISS
jgi:hypothetical protein